MMIPKKKSCRRIIINTSTKNIKRRNRKISNCSKSTKKLQKNKNNPLKRLSSQKHSRNKRVLREQALMKYRQMLGATKKINSKREDTIRNVEEETTTTTTIETKEEPTGVEEAMITLEEDMVEESSTWETRTLLLMLRAMREQALLLMPITHTQS